MDISFFRPPPVRIDDHNSNTETVSRSWLHPTSLASIRKGIEAATYSECNVYILWKRIVATGVLLFIVEIN